jgi:hypothetical protein
VQIVSKDVAAIAVAHLIAVRRSEKTTDVLIDSPPVDDSPDALNRIVP